MKKIITISIVSLVTGVLIVLTGYFVYSVVKINTQVNTNSQVLSEIVSYLNSQIAQQEKVTTK